MRTIFTFLLLIGLANIGLSQRYQMLIDPKGHNGKVHEMLFTPDNRLISLSEDKSIQVWDIETQTLVDKFFAPLDLGPEGMIYSAALDQKGRTLAYSGYIRQDSVFAIVLFDLVTKKESIIVKGHSSPISALEFSPDNQKLASGDLDGNVTIWSRIDESIEVEQTFSLTESVNDLSFSRTGRELAVATKSKYLNVISLFQSFENKRIEKHYKGVNKGLFTPDSLYLITAGQDGFLHLFNEKGKHIRKIDKLDEPVTALSVTADSKILIALTEGSGIGKTYSIPDGKHIGTFGEHDNTVMSVAVSPNVSFGGYQVVSSGGTNNQIMIWNPTSGRLSAILNGDGLPVWNLSFADSANLLIGNSSSSNRYNFSFVFDSQQLLDVDQLVEKKEATIQKLNPYRWRVNDRLVNNKPEVDGRILSVLEQDSNVFVGSDFSLKMYSISGETMSSFIGHAGAVRSLALSPNGLYLLSSSDDQKIIGWKLDKAKKEIEPAFQLFITKSGEWVLWSEDGYYSSSPRGAEYLGWKTATGYDAETSYFTVDQYFEILYRPKAFAQSFKTGENVDEILKSRGERKFDLNDLNKPSLAFFGKAYATDKSGKSFYLRNKSFSQMYTTDVSPVTFETTLYDRGGGIKEFKVYHNDKLALIEKNISQKSEKRIDKEFSLPLLSGVNKIEIMATNFQNIDSKPHVMNVEFTGETSAISDLYVFTIGINEYENPSYNLNYALADAQSFSKKIIENSSEIYNAVYTYEIFNDEATYANIESKIMEVQEKAKLQDVFIFYYAGHGTIDDQDNSEYYLVPTDITQLYGDSRQLKEKGISASKIKEWLASVRAQKQLILLDACHSGEAVQTFAARAASSEERAIVQLARSSGTVLISASGSKQFATEFEELKHGAFTYALLEGLDGKADGGNRDGKITVNEIKAYMEDRVPQLTTEYGGGNAQYPTGFSTGQDFPVKVSGGN